MSKYSTAHKFGGLRSWELDVCWTVHVCPSLFSLFIYLINLIFIPPPLRGSEMSKSGEATSVYVEKAGNVFILCYLNDVAYCMGTVRKL